MIWRSMREGGSISHRTVFAAACFAWLSAIAFLPGSARSETIRIGGTGGALGGIQAVATAFMKVHPGIEVVVFPSVGSSGAIKAAEAGAIDVGISARALKAEETSKDLVVSAYAKTPFVFAVNGKGGSRPILTLAQVAGIYSGKITKWPDGRIVRLILRPKEDSDTQSLRKMSPEMDLAVTEAFERAGMANAMTDQQSADMIERSPGALGTMTLCQIISEKRDVTPVTLDGVTPSIQTLENGSYRHSKTLYLLTGPSPPPNVRKFLEFLGSPAGRGILRKNGQLPLETKAQSD